MSTVEVYQTLGSVFGSIFGVGKGSVGIKLVASAQHDIRELEHAMQGVKQRRIVNSVAPWPGCEHVLHSPAVHARNELPQCSSAVVVQVELLVAVE